MMIGKRLKEPAHGCADMRDWRNMRSVGKKRGGYGLTYSEVWDNEDLTIEAKAIYGMLCTYAGSGSKAFPSVDLLCTKLQISRDRFYKHMNLLIGAGIVKKEMVKTENGKYKTNIYTLVPNIGKTNFPYTGNQYTDIPDTGNQDNNINNLNINSLNNNRGEYKQDIVDYQEIVNLYNDTCVSFPKVLALSESRKKAIKARLKSYSLEDFKKLFEMAESSRFLKGGNDRNWSANFDWLIKDSNMAKVLEGNYEDRNSTKPKQTGTGNIFLDMLQEEEEKEERG